MIESIVEDLATKKDLFRELNHICAGRRHPRHQHVDAAGHRPGHGDPQARPGLRRPLLQSGADDEPGRDRAAAHRHRRDDRRGAGVRRGLRQEPGRGQGPGRLHRQRAAVPVPEQRRADARERHRHPRRHRHRHEGRVQLPDGSAGPARPGRARHVARHPRRALRRVPRSQLRRRCRCCAAWSAPASSVGSRAPASTTTPADRPRPPTALLGRAVGGPRQRRSCRTPVCRSSPRRPPGPSHRPARPTMSASSASAPTSSPAPCWPPTGGACSRCPSGVATGWRGGRPTPAACSRSTACGSPGRSASRAAATRSRVDTAFEAVIERCADPAATAAGSTATSWPPTRDCTGSAGPTASRPGAATELVGGLYGVSIGGLFAGESMFHDARDASKVALVALVDRLPTAGPACSTCSGPRRTWRRSASSTSPGPATCACCGRPCGPTSSRSPAERLRASGHSSSAGGAVRSRAPRGARSCSHHA